MYRCDKCEEVTERKQPRLLITEETRPKYYDDGGQGHETVKELKVCRKCFGLGPPLVTPTDYRETQKPTPVGAFSVRLADGKEVTTDSAFELSCFWNSDGRSIEPGQKAKGGKSKGARGKGRKTVTRTRDASPPI